MQLQELKKKNNLWHLKMVTFIKINDYYCFRMSRPGGIQFLDFDVFTDVFSDLLRRPDQVFWLWTRCSDPVWYQKRPLHRQRIPRGEQVAGHAWWVHQKICAVSRVWQPWNWSGKSFTAFVTQLQGSLTSQYDNWQVSLGDEHLFA